MPPRSAPDRHVRGLTYVFVAGVLYASAGVFTRGLTLHAWTLVAWRSLFGAAFLMLLVAAETGRFSLRDYRIGALRWTLVPIGAAATICYIFALKITTVANVMIVYATTPFVTAIVAWIWVREVPTRRMLTASTLALGGVGVMILGGDTSRGNLLGAGMIAFMNVSFALSLVLARRNPDRSMNPVNALALLLAALVSFLFAPPEAIGAGRSRSSSSSASSRSASPCRCSWPGRGWRRPPRSPWSGSPTWCSGRSWSGSCFARTPGPPRCSGERSSWPPWPGTSGRTPGMRLRIGADGHADRPIRVSFDKARGIPE